MGYRNLLAEQVGYVRQGVQYPRPGVKEPGVPPNGYLIRDVVLVEIITQWPSPVMGQPPPPRLPFQPIRVRKKAPAPTPTNAHAEITVGEWDAVTNEYGSVIVAVYLQPGGKVGTWAVETHLWEPLPDKTGDGDRCSLIVVAP